LSNKLDLDLWHSRMGHPSHDVVKRALTHCNIPFSGNGNSIPCVDCMKSKMHKLPFNSVSTYSYAPLELIRSDLWGSLPSVSHNGFRYYVSFIDHATRFTWIYLLKNKSQTLPAFTQFKQLVENQLNKKIKALQTDGGGEFIGMTNFLNHVGIKHKISCPYTPEQNGLAERNHRNIVEVGLSLLSQSSMPLMYWDEAFTSAVHLINLTPKKILQYITPHEKLTGTRPDYSHLRNFGCLCFPNLRPFTRNKLEPRSQPSTFLGYSPKHKGYKILLPNKKIIISRDVIFADTVFPFALPDIPPHNKPATTMHSPNDCPPSLNLIPLIHSHDNSPNTSDEPSSSTPHSPTHTHNTTQHSSTSTPASSPHSSPHTIRIGQIIIDLPVEHASSPMLIPN
ncbi:Uncharacterized mitochondrial protein AtMg00710, partial [Striga hermonthica]